MRQRFYVDGKLTESISSTPEKLRKWLDNTTALWSKDGLFLLTPKGQFDFNKCHSILRVSQDELLVTTTKGSKLRWINVK